MQTETLALREQAQNALDHWRQEEKMALALLAAVGTLRFDHGVELVLFRQDLYDCRPSTVLQHHHLAAQYGAREVAIPDTLALAQAVQKLALPPAKIDLGKLALEWSDKAESATDFLSRQLKHIIGQSPRFDTHKDVVLYGFGRIGRLAARRIIGATGRGEQLRLKAIVIRPKMKDRYEEAVKRAALLQSDSVHGNFHGTIEVAESGEELLINGNRIKLIYAGAPEEIDYTQYGILNAIVIDNTGVWRDREGLSRHLRPGISQVLLTAPGKGDVPNIVHGVNQDAADQDTEQLFSAASCTTNAIAPVLAVLEEKLGIENGHVETIHSYTNDQNLLDNFHKKPRRGRGAPTNMVLTSTGAASAVAKVMPGLKGKLTGNAIRVPTPNVSLAVLKLSLKAPAQAEQINELLRAAAMSGGLVEQIRYSNSTEYVSSNAVGSTATSIVDAPSTQVSQDGRNAVVYVWYDNEYGYTCQVVRLAKHLARVRRYHYY